MGEEIAFVEGPLEEEGGLVAGLSHHSAHHGLIQTATPHLNPTAHALFPNIYSIQEEKCQ